MKIRNIFILILVFCILLPGCATITHDSEAESTQPATPATKPTVSTPSATEPTKISLTLDNVNNYFIFNTKVEDVTISSEPLGNERGKGKVTVSVSCKKRAEFENVVLTIRLTTTSSGWGSMENREIQISYDGSAEQTFSIYSSITSYVSSSPSYKVEVTAVSGYVVG